VSETQISIRFEGKNDVRISVVANEKKQKRPAGFYAGAIELHETLFELSGI
jgi:hypothetical protein